MIQKVLIFPSLAAVYAKLSTLVSTALGQGASIIGIHDANTHYDGDTVEEALEEIADGTALDDRYVKRQQKVRIVTATDTVAITDDLVVCNKATDMTINLPAATGSGRFYDIKNINTGIVEVNANSSETIDGELTQEVYTDESITVIDYLTGVWSII